MLAGALPALAFPAPSWWWIAWVGLIPLLFVVRAAPTAGRGAVRAWLAMAAFVGVTQYWLWPVAGPLLLVLAVAIGALWLPWGWAAHRLLTGALTGHGLLTAVAVLPSMWILAEAVRSWHRLGGAWAVLGASQWNQPATLAPASLGGVWLVSFLVVAVNTAVVGAILLRTSRAIALPVALAAIGPAWFWLAPAPEPAPTMRVALVQPGDIEDATPRQAASEALTAGLAGQSVDLVVWGESSVGVDLAQRPDVAARLARLSRLVGADLLVNVDARTASGGIYKSSVLIGPGGVLGSYAKTRLVPFGEYVPLRSVLGRVTEGTAAAGEDRRQGDGPVVLRTGGVGVGPLISFETLFSDLARKAVELGADLIAYQSATSSYQGSWAQPQLASMAAVHAAEVGHPAVHAGLSGVSSAFDATGRRLAWLPASERGVAVVDVPLAARPTGYLRWGDWVVGLALVLTTAWCARSAHRSWTGARRSQVPSRATGRRWWTARRCRPPADRP
ncbi:apolipoprotein N-acyltransferase [Mycobacterium sp. IDR2000157661]|nr:apolipoprotein N-acyltransferase [Mycobacterium sp. IDR2000157661]